MARNFLRTAKYSQGVALAVLLGACQTNPNNPDPVSDPGCLAALNAYNETAEYYLREVELGNMTDEEFVTDADPVLTRLDLAVQEECDAE